MRQGGGSNKVNGFTLTELLITIAILSILLVVGYVIFRIIINKGNTAKILSEMSAMATAGGIYEKTNNQFAPDVGPDTAPSFVPGDLQEWPKFLCGSAVVYDWDSWLSHNVVDADGTPWTPIVRISIRRRSDDTTIYYHCIKPNAKGKCTCEDVHFPGDRYCKGYGPIQTAPQPVTCSDLESIEKFPSFPLSS